MVFTVSMGGTAGLFVGASLLSFAEFIYFFSLRIYNRKKDKATFTPQSVVKIINVTPSNYFNTSLLSNRGMISDMNK